MASSTSATEREKMTAGQLYNSLYPQLVQDRANARKVTNKFNASDDPDERNKIIASLIKCVGIEPDSELFPWIEPPFRCDYGYNIEIGARSYMNFDCVVLDCAPVKIGCHVMFGPGVHLYAAEHPTNPQQRRDNEEFAHPIIIRDNVWIGGHSTILAGVEIGENSVIGAGSVVTKNIPPDSVAVGNPCRVIRKID